MVVTMDVDEDVQNQLEEAWKRRPNGGVGIFDGPEALYWIEIGDSEDTGNTGDSGAKGDTTENENKDTGDSGTSGGTTENGEKTDTVDSRATGNTTENEIKTFSKLTPHNAYRLVSKFINPLKGGLYRKRDGKFCAQIPRAEVELAIKIVNFGDTKVSINKDKFANRSRGTVWHPDIKFMPEDEIL